MSNVVKDHARYTVPSATLLVKKQLVKYDKYDKTNDLAASTCLLASLSGPLSSKVEEKVEETDPFPIVWLQFLKAIQSTSRIERFEDLKSSIRLRLPSQYPGQNLELLAAQFRKDALELTTAGQYDHNLTLTMMKIFLLAGGSAGEDYKFALRTTKQKLEDALLEIGFKKKSAANRIMVDLKLTYRDICAQAEDKYRVMFDRKEWPPALNLKDSKSPPSAYGNVAIGPKSPITRGEVMNLIQMKPRFNSGGSDKKPGNCNKCGKPGHWAKECPSNSNNNGKQQSDNPRAQRQGGRQGHRPNDRNNRTPGWRSTPPAPGAPTTKTTENHTFNWCATCKRWSTTHSTATHTGSSTGPSASMATAPLVQDPSVWLAEYGPGDQPTINDILYVMRNLPLLIKIPMTLLLLPISLLVVSVFSFLFNTIHQLVGSFLGQLSWKLIVDNLSNTIDILLLFLQHRYSTLFAPLLWVTLAVLLVWARDPPPTPLLPHPPGSRPPRNQRRRRRQEARRERRRNLSPKLRSIRTEGFHRRYPLDLRAMGKFIRRPPPPITQTFQKWDFINLRNDVERLKILT